MGLDTTRGARLWVSSLPSLLPSPRLGVAEAEPSFALPHPHTSPGALGIPRGLGVLGGAPLVLTMQAACTASEMVPASGSHQKAAHWKRRPVSTMSAKVWASRPTPRNVTYRTWHSQMCAASSSSCGDPVDPSTPTTAPAAPPPPAGPLCQEAGHPLGVARPSAVAAGRLLRPEPPVPLPTCAGCTLMAVSDTWMREGVQRSRLGPLISFSMASFSTSIPGEQDTPAHWPLARLQAWGRQGTAGPTGSAQCWVTAAQPPHGGWALGCPPAAVELAALTHGPGHRQAANVQRLIGLHRLPHRF